MSAPRSRRVRLATGLAYHVLEWGADDPARDHTLVLVHGFLDLAWGWAPTVDAALGERFHVIAPDMRGHGDSDRVGRGGYYHFFDYLADLHSLIGQVRRERLSLVGHSMGGSICGYYAGAYPDALHRLALLEGTGPPERDDDAGEQVRRWISSWRMQAGATPRVYPDVAAAAERLRRHDPALTPELATFLADKGTREVSGGRSFKHDSLHLTMGPYPFRVEVAQQLWRNVSCPVLLVEGSASRLRHAPDEAARRNGSFRHASTAVLEGAGHMMQRHRPRELAALLAGFLAEP